MGELIRQHDWAATAVGPPAQWPQSLRTALGIVLHARVPMLLWWGPELIQFFNDACRPSLDQTGKLPTALDQRGADCWPEAWPTIRPLIEQVLAGGEATGGENQWIPIERDGRMEHVFWSFGYSPVWSETGQVAGVLGVGQDTTREVLALQEQQERYRFALEAAQFGVWEVDVATNMVRWDDRSAELFDQSYRSNTLSREQAFRVIHPDDLPALEEAFARATNPASGGRYDMTCRVMGASDGHMRWGRFIGQAYFNAAGEITRFRGIAHNITQEKELQQQLEASAAKLRMIFDKAPVGIFIVRGPELTFELMNERYQAMTGRMGNLVGQPFGSGLPLPVPELPEATRLLREVLHTGQATAFGEFQINLPRNGRLEPGYYNMVMEPLYEDDGRVSGVFVTIAEVTRSVLSRHRVEANEAYLQRVFRHAAVGIIIYQWPDYVIELANPAIFALCGRPEEQLLGRPLFDALPEIALLGARALAAVRRTGQPFIGTELSYALPHDGKIKTVYVDLVCEPLLDDDGRVHRIIQTMTDVTERVLARRHVEELLEREQKLNALKSNFVTLASHEFRTPMSTILSLAALIGRYNGPDKEDKRERHVQRIKTAVHSLTTLLEDFTSLSRMEEQILHSRPHSLELRHFCEEILEDMQRVIKPGQRLLYRHLAGEPTILMHGQILKNILLNLLGNASKYSAAEKEIVLTTAVQDKQLVLTVKDEGIGIPEPDQNQLFVTFFRARNTRHIPGTGLGLYLVKHYVDLLGGRIGFTSQLAVGTTFTVELPLSLSYPPRHENNLSY